MDECLACLGDFSMRKQRERADGDTRSEAIVSGVGRFLTHFVRPFSIAHLRRRAGGIWISCSSLARLASCLFSLIRICVARIVSVPGSVI